MIRAFVELVQNNARQGMVVCEVGAWVGKTTVEYLPIVQANDGRVLVVDWFSGNEDIVDNQNHIHAYKPNNADDIYTQFMKNVEAYQALVTVVRARSNEGVEQIPDASLDICFIDADHIYAGVKRDIELYLPKVKPGGILCGHDCEDIVIQGLYRPYLTSLEQILR